VVEYIITKGNPDDVAICNDCITAYQEIIELKKKEETK